MVATYLTGLAAITVVLVCWLGVQSAWKRVFTDPAGDPDALAGRLGCHGCGCTEPCDDARRGRAGSGEEER